MSDSAIYHSLRRFVASQLPKIKFPNSRLYRQVVRVKKNATISKFNDCIALLSPTERANFETTCHAPGIWKPGLVKAVDQRLNAILCNCSDASSRLSRAQLLERLVRSRLEYSLTAQSPDRMRRMECRFQADQSLMIPVIIPALIVHSTQVVLVDCLADSSAQTRSCILVGSKMYPAVNASVGDVVGNLPE